MFCSRNPSCAPTRAERPLLVLACRAEFAWRCILSLHRTQDDRVHHLEGCPWLCKSMQICCQARLRTSALSVAVLTGVRVIAGSHAQKYFHKQNRGRLTEIVTNHISEAPPVQPCRYFAICCPCAVHVLSMCCP